LFTLFEKTRLQAGFFLSATLDPIPDKIHSGGYYGSAK
jgi:hypothetical protein